jgi:hypothetical protein
MVSERQVLSVLGTLKGGQAGSSLKTPEERLGL